MSRAQNCKKDYWNNEINNVVRHIAFEADFHLHMLIILVTVEGGLATSERSAGEKEMRGRARRERAREKREPLTRTRTADEREKRTADAADERESRESRENAHARDVARACPYIGGHARRQMSGSRCHKKASGESASE